MFIIVRSYQIIFICLQVSCQPVNNFNEVSVANYFYSKLWNITPSFWRLLLSSKMYANGLWLLWNLSFLILSQNFLFWKFSNIKKSFKNSKMNNHIPSLRVTNSQFQPLHLLYISVPFLVHWHWDNYLVKPSYNFL